MALFIGPFWVLLCIFWLNSVVFWGNSWLVFNADVLQRFFYTISKLSQRPAKVLSEKIVFNIPILYCLSYTCILILLCLSFFRSRAISGWVWMGWDGLGSLCGAIVWASLCDANNMNSHMISHSFVLFFHHGNIYTSYMHIHIFIYELINLNIF